MIASRTSHIELSIVAFTIFLAILMVCEVSL
jgi:hypothetical protein